MSYTPPSGNAIVLALKSGYAPPVGDSVPLALGVTGPSVFVTGASGVVFSSAGTYDTAFSVTGQSSVNPVPRDQYTSFDIQATANALFSNPDRAFLFSSVSSGVFASQKVSEGGYKFDGLSVVDFRRKTDWTIACTSTVSLVGERLVGHNVNFASAASCAFKGRSVSQSFFGATAQSVSTFYGRFVIPTSLDTASSSSMSATGAPRATGELVAQGRASFLAKHSSFSVGEMLLNTGASVYFSNYSGNINDAHLSDGVSGTAVLRRSDSVVTSAKQRVLHVFG